MGPMVPEAKLTVSSDERRGCTTFVSWQVPSPSRSGSSSAPGGEDSLRCGQARPSRQSLAELGRAVAERLSQCRGKLAACCERLEALERGGKGDVAQLLLDVAQMLRTLPERHTPSPRRGASRPESPRFGQRIRSESPSTRSSASSGKMPKALRFPLVLSK